METGVENAEKHVPFQAVELSGVGNMAEGSCFSRHQRPCNEL